ncbi:MAG: ABC transporter ATP-binding protein [Oscillospiraceae bacterium]|nr:ABC transporter ATP-binding protein [Oscillospiraceae bacterium]
MIRFENVSKSYKQQKVVSDVSFTINDHELVVLIGPSGCGKTTMLKMINRLTNPTSGRILINEEDIRNRSEVEHRKSIGYVIQSIGLFPHMTIRQNIEIIPRLQGKNKDEILQKSRELMQMVGLDPDLYFDRYPYQLSGGQQQRVGVARAFACDPDIILMDEPFSALDPLTRLQLQDELADLQTKMKKTIVFVTHDMDEAVKIADRICIINEGQIVQYDTVEEIMKHPANEFVAEFVGRNRIWTSPEYIYAKDIMVKNPVCVSPSTSLFRCMERMRMYKVDSLFVVDSEKQLLGLVQAKMIQTQANTSIPVSEIMHKDIDGIGPDTNIVEILQKVSEKGINTIPVVDERHVLVGLITKSSLLTTLSHQYLDTSEVV